MRYKFYQSVPKVIKQLADEGHNLVIDEAIWEREKIENYASILKNHQVCYVKVNCELPLIREREIIRGDRPLGMAQGLYAKIKELKWDYNLEVDTSYTGSFANAKKILEFAKENNP